MDDDCANSQAQQRLAHKFRPTRRAKIFRLIKSALDLRAWLHLLKIINYYNYTHVVPMRELALGSEPAISPDASFSNHQRIKIGDRARIGSRCHLWAGPRDGKISIGHDVLMGPEVMITAATYDYRSGCPISDQPMREADVVIGNDVWLATRAIILPGTIIGDGCIVAAGAVVKGHVPSGSIVAGVPAQIISQRFNQECL
ncbi:acyltransferase [Aurantiacibacter sp. MUD11]|uniref:acyltransferase n=1 Tax=Aurantiacibacter sp. MUD11 TaxID=3003265 RepID=UPI0022AA6735|nr:acyltransferase [Aurantiacibacter sp. MUD11]WAT19333.1 acyltransferase [Aurantiacibacter sp. MUD11]